jgi:MFS transporter, CP family, cyanate transporter
MRFPKQSAWGASVSSYLVLLAGVCAALHVGKLSAALPVLQAALDISLLQAGFLLSLVQLSGMTLGLAVGLVADGLGLKRCMVTGLLVLFLTSGLGGFAVNVVPLLILRMMEGIGFLLVTLSAPGMIRNLVPTDQLNKMMGFWGAYMPMGTATALLLGPWVIHIYSWPVWWWGLSVFSLSVGVLIWCLAEQPDKSNNLAVISWRARTQQTLNSREAWLLAICFFMYSGQWLAVIGFLPVIYEQAGYASDSTAVLTALVAAVNMIGNIASGLLLSRRISPQILLYTGFTVMALGSAFSFADYPWLWSAPLNSVLRYAGVLLFSMVGGLIPGTLFSLAVQIAAGRSALSTTVGWMQQWSAFGQFAGPPFVAWVAVLSGGWQLTWGVTGTCSLAGLVLSKLICKRVRT